LVKCNLEGRAYKETRDRPNANVEQVSPGYDAVIGQKVLQGRTFADDDNDLKLPAAVVNSAFARRHFGTDNPLSRRFRTVTESTAQPGPWRTVIGVVSTVRMVGPYNDPTVDDSGFYVPFTASLFGPVPAAPVPSQFATVLVAPRPGQQADTLLPMLRREMDKVDRNLPLYYVGTPREHIDRALAQYRVIAAMFVVFGLVAVVLAAVGLYGVMSFSVNQRRQEFGVRMALGADNTSIVSMVLGQGVRQLGAGLAVGFGLALLLASAGRSLLAAMLYNVNPHDPFSYAVVFAVVTLVSLVAILVPGRRASKVDPMVALRAE
jgi:hypothetical protein